ncbi:MAG: ParA family protein [Polyangiaceae bacterium]
MKRLAVVSQKGGVGKTTLSLNLAYALAKSGVRTLLLDVDPQGGVGLSLNGHGAARGLTGLLEGAPVDECLLTTRMPELVLCPIGDVAITATPQLAASLEDGSQMNALLGGLESRFDVVVVDTPPGFGGITLGAMRATSNLIVPLQAEPIGLRSLPQLLQVVGDLSEQGTPTRMVGIVLSMLQQRIGESLGVAEEVWTRLPAELVLETTIPRDTVFLKASSAGVPLGLLRRPPPPLASLFDALASEVLERLGVGTDEADDEPLSLFA